MQTVGVLLDDRIVITVVGDPVPAPRPHVARAGGVIKHRSYDEYKTEIAWIARTTWRGKPHTGDVRITVAAFTKTRRRRDVDNLLKGPMDALTSIVYDDDDQVVDARVIKGHDALNPRTVITVYPLQEVSAEQTSPA